MPLEYELRVGARVMRRCHWESRASLGFLRDRALSRSLELTAWHSRGWGSRGGMGATEPGPAEQTAHAEKRHRKMTRSPRGPARGSLSVSFLHLQSLVHLLCPRHWPGSREQRDVKT